MKKEDIERLIRHIDFLEMELNDFSQFKVLTWKEYQNDSVKRRNVERWIENLINSAIDISKIVLAIENMPIPQTYREILYNLGATPYFDEEFSGKLSRWAKLRNIVAHEYLDIRWENIKEFIDNAEPIFEKFVRVIKQEVIGNKRNTKKKNNKSFAFKR